MSTFGKDTPLERPVPGGRAAVFVPSPTANENVKAAVKNGSGIVGFGNIDGSLTLYFENNKFNDSSLFPWESKVAKAYDRMVKQSPTVNRMTADPDSLEQVGDIEDGDIIVKKMDSLTRWLTQCNALDTSPSAQKVPLKG